MTDNSFIIIIAVLFLSNTIYGLAAPFLPILLESRGIAESFIGLIFAAYAIAYCIMAPIIGMVVDKVGHSRIMALGIFLMAMSIACFGFGIYIESNSDLVTTAITLRMCQGIASSMINTAAYSFAAQAYRDEIGKYVSLFEGFVGIGITAGPILGSLVYSYLGFSKTFFIFGAVMAPASFLVLSILPSPK